MRFALFFWWFKLFKICLTAGGMLLFLLWPGLGEKGIFAAAVVGSFGFAFLFQDGFSKRQWRRGEYHGINEVMVWFGRIMMGIAALIAFYWFSDFMLENFARGRPDNMPRCFGLICYD